VKMVINRDNYKDKRQFSLKREHCDQCGERVLDPDNRFCGDCQELMEAQMAKHAGFMTREYAIEVIQSLYPADSDWPDTAKVGQELLERAEREVAGWKTKPTEVLIRYAELCLEREGE